MCIGSIYAADANVSSINIHDSIQISSSNDFDDDLDLDDDSDLDDEDYDDDSDWDDFDDDLDLDDDSDWDDFDDDSDLDDEDSDWDDFDDDSDLDDEDSDWDDDWDDFDEDSDLDDEDYDDDSDWDDDWDDFGWFAGNYKILYKDYVMGAATAKFSNHYASDYNISDYEYLEFRIMSYLDNFGNCSDENWTTSDDFLAEYQLYLENPGNYNFNESDENYETYLKIYDSIVSKFEDYNLTQNETDYLKFLVIYYLNNYGNCSNYTWDESCDFCTYYMTKFLATSCPNEVLSGFASSNADNSNSNFEESNFIAPFYSGNVAYNVLSDSIDSNSTQLNNSTQLKNSTVTFNMNSNGGENNLLMLLFAVLMMIVLII